MRIYLVGFMNSGKTTLGREVALDLQVPFMDTDIMVQEAEGMSIEEIFSEKGEYWFRRAEQEVLLSTLGADKALIATGGGLPAFQQNMDWINRHGISIYLEWPLHRLQERLKENEGNRPLLSERQEAEREAFIEKLFLTRKPFYEQAAMTIEMSGDEGNDGMVLQQACRYIW